MAKKETSRKIKCLGSCGRELALTNANFYKSNNPQYTSTDSFTPICKQCLREMCFTNGVVDIDGVKKALQHLNKPFIRKIFEELLATGFTIGDYNSRLNFGSYKNMTYADSDSEDNIIDNKKENINNELQNTVNRQIVITEDDKKNEEDVIRILGYDPFVTDCIEDRRLMFNSLIDFLDEETQADNFKCLTVIEIVKLFNQAERLNLTINTIMKDYKSITENSGLIKSLMDTKKNMLASALALAKDNGISVNHNNNKSKGGNTLNGIIKKLEEIGLDEARVNLFDLETCEAMKQIADISHKSILDQLVLDENDYTSMITQQKDIIRKLDEKVMRLEEDNRLMKIKLKFYENQEEKEKQK